MNAPRVSDELLESALEEFGHMPTFEMQLAKDLKDARDQLKTHQEMRRLYNKEPE